MIKPVSGALAAITELQCGVLTTRQAVEAGLSVDQVTAKVRFGRWRRMYRGVYATFPANPPGGHSCGRLS